MILSKNVIADFYMYEYLLSSDATYDKNLELEIKYGALVFLDKLKDYLLTVLEYSIIREISHVWWETIQPNTMNPPTREYLESIIDERIFYIVIDLAPEWVNSLPYKIYNGEELKNCSKLPQYMFIKHHPDIDSTTFIRIFKKYFTKLSWANDHGGENWLKITDSYLKLMDTYGEDLFVVCDTIFWLQHNTNTVFNKIKSLEENGSYKWINEFLDFRKECDLWDLWEYCSVSKKLAAKKMKMVYETKEEIEMEENLFTITATQNSIPTIGDLESGIDTKLDDLTDSIRSDIIGMKNDFITSITTVEKMVDDLPNELDSIKTDLYDKLDSFQQDTNAYMNNIDKSITMFKTHINEAREETIEDLTSYIDVKQKDLEDRISKTMFFVRNEILEKLEQRWYTIILNFFKKMF